MKILAKAGGFAVGWTLAATMLSAQPPAGYYDPVDDSDPVSLRHTLHDAIADHVRFPYSVTDPEVVDTWIIVNLADQDPNDVERIVDLYRNASYPEMDGGVGAYQREHVWPKSYGFPEEPTAADPNYPYTDCHHLFAAASSYNGSRGNKPFRECDGDCAPWVTVPNDGRGGGDGVRPGNSNWTTGIHSSGTWETWDGRKGDVARAVFYMDVRYDGGHHGGTGAAEPDLIATDDEARIAASATGENEEEAYMGMLSTLLAWHHLDPVDSREVWRNEAVFGFQGNRNPFIDHPEWADCIYAGRCGDDADFTPPAAPAGLMATAEAGAVELSWTAVSDADLAGYHAFRASGEGAYARITRTPVTEISWTDTQALSAGATYRYVVRSVDAVSNLSGASNAVEATLPSSLGGVILSEVLYDVEGGDDGWEWVELYNSALTPADLSGYCLGNGGTDYAVSTVQLEGTVGSGETFVVGGPMSGAVNGHPDFGQLVDFDPDFQNSGGAGDGMALFDVPCSQVGAATVPLDAVVYGPDNASGLIDETGFAHPPEVEDAPAGSSIERIDLAGHWQIRSSPDPGPTPLPPPDPGTSTGALLLTEVFYDARDADDGLEWVELYNPGATTVDLAGMSLGNGGTEYTYSLVQLAGTVAPGETFVVGGPLSSGANGDPALDLAVDFDPDFQNSGSAADGVALFAVPAAEVTAATVPVDAVVYGPVNANGLLDETGAAHPPEVGDASAGFSIGRFDLAGAWRIQRHPTPGVVCLADQHTACLLDGRFRVEGLMSDFATPPRQIATRVMRFAEERAESDQAVFFESFGAGNFEIGVKMLDACGLPDGHPLRAFWAFFGGLTNADTEIEAEDTVTGQVYRWSNPAGEFPVTRGDTGAFPCVAGTPATACQRGDHVACLLDGRFRVTGRMMDFSSPPVEVPVRVMRFPGGRAESDQAAFFESFDAGNFEIGVKMVDACSLPEGNPLRRFWVFYGGLTNAGTTVQVTQLGRGEVDVWTNPSGVFPRSQGRTDAFPCD